MPEINPSTLSSSSAWKKSVPRSEPHPPQPQPPPRYLTLLPCIECDGAPQAHGVLSQGIQLNDSTTNLDTTGAGDKERGSVKPKHEQYVDVDDDYLMAVTNRNKTQGLLEAAGSGLAITGAVRLSTFVALSAPAASWFSIMAQQDTIAPSSRHYLQPPVARLLDWPRSGTGHTLA
ncbi:hypothetical protein BGZ82_007669 [Podila clonocystis]|nr:hypothetical protein BGZ82_007669 [Podila clonocystis]